MQRLTIVIPAWGQEDRFEATLLSVLENRPGNCEILVPHCGDYEDPYHLADEVTFVEQGDANNGIGLLNAAARTSRGQILHVLQPGTSVSANWTENAVDRFSDKLLGTVSPIVTTSDSNRIATAGVAYTASGTRKEVAAGAKFQAGKQPKKKALGPSLTAGFYRLEALREVGGWHSTVGEHLSDVDLALSLHAVGWTCEVEPSATITIDKPLAAPEPSFRQAWLAERLFWRHAAESGWVKSLAMHPIAIAWESLGSLPGSLLCPLARMLALVEVPRHLGHRGKLLDEVYGWEADDADEALLPFPESSGDRPPMSKAS